MSSSAAASAAPEYEAEAYSDGDEVADFKEESTPEEEGDDGNETEDHDDDDDAGASEEEVYEYEYEYEDEDEDENKDGKGDGEGSEALRASIVIRLDRGVSKVVDRRVDKHGHPEVTAEFLDTVELMDQDDLAAETYAYEKLKADIERPKPPAKAHIVLLAVGLVFLALACVAAAVWFLFPYDVEPFNGKYSKQGRDTTWSWVIGGVACGAALLLLITAILGFTAAGSRSTCAANSFFWLLLLSTLVLTVALCGTYYVYYSDTAIATSTVQSEAGVVALSGVGILLFIMLPCGVVARLYHHDLIAYESHVIDNNSRSRSDRSERSQRSERSERSQRSQRSQRSEQSETRAAGRSRSSPRSEVASTVESAPEYEGSS